MLLLLKMPQDAFSGFAILAPVERGVCKLGSGAGIVNLCAFMNITFLDGIKLIRQHKTGYKIKHYSHECSKDLGETNIVTKIYTILSKDGEHTQTDYKITGECLPYSNLQPDFSAPIYP